MKLEITILLIVSTPEFTFGNVLGSYRSGVVQYSTNILHESKKLPNRIGKSYTNYHFDTSEVKQKRKASPLQNILYTQALGGSTAKDTDLQQPQLHYLQTEIPHNQDTSKLFNVGYTIHFANSGQKELNQPKQSRQNDDVIIGTRGAEMPRPANVEEIVLNEFLDNKKRKLSGIKPKYYRPLSHGLDTKHLIAQANLSPKTQKKLAELQISDQSSSLPSYAQNSNTKWTSLSPGVEIYHSNNIYESNEYSDQFRHFDHAKALEKSVSFDHTNAINVSEEEANNNLETLYANRVAQQKIAKRITPQYLQV